MKKSAVLHFRQFTQELESLIGPLLVFLICLCHHLYFSHQIVSTIFIVSGLLSLVAVHAFSRFGITFAAAIQLLFLGWVALDTHELFFEQLVFSLSLLAGLFASMENRVIVAKPQESNTKDKLWAELYEARQELKSLYQKGEEMQQLLDVATVEKGQFVEELQAKEADILKLMQHLKEMAERPLESPDARYLQLREQFTNKSKVLDDTRRELFLVQEEKERLLRTLAEQEMRGPSTEERALLEQLRQLEERCEAQEQEIAGLEHMVEKLLQQLSSTS